MRGEHDTANCTIINVNFLVQRFFCFQKILLLLSCTTLCSNFLSAGEQPTVHSVSVKGNHAFTESKLIDVIATKSHTEFSATRCSRDLQSLLGYYHNEGYYAVDIQLSQLAFSGDSSSIEITFTIREGELTRVGKIELEGNTALTRDDIIQNFETHIGGLLEPATLERDIDALSTRYEQLGYPFVTISITAVTTYQEQSSEKLHLGIQINEGEKIHIQEIHVTGNSETSEHVIVRESGIRTGDLYNQNRIDKIPQRLNRMNIFSKVQDPEFYVNTSGVGGLLINVQEGTTNTFDGVVGYVPSLTSGASGYLTGLVNVTMKNLFGTARKLNLHWQRDDRYSQELAARYVEPWVLDLPVDVSGAFQQRQQDTTYVRNEVELKADVHLIDEFSVGGLFSQENVIPSSTVSGLSLSNSRTITTGLELRYDSRDDIYSPTSGVNYRSDYLVGNKKIANPAPATKNTFTVQKISFDAEFYAQPFLHQVVTLSFHGRQILSNNIEAGDKFRFGGTTTLRGYREKQFLGSRIGWTNTEYRFLLARRSYFFGFFDTGYYFLPGDDVKGISSIERFKYGFGFGIRLETSLGNIGVSFALGEGDSFSQGKIHVGLMNDF